MLLGFKERFAPMVEDGSKTHTIRAKRTAQPRVGETCHCYTGLRQKGARLLGRWECLKVQDIRIQLRCRKDGFPIDLGIWVDGQRLDPDEVNQLAWRDGFRPVRKCDAWVAMFHFWHDVHGLGPFAGNLIHWKFKKESTSTPGENAPDPQIVQKKKEAESDAG
jgi:hypothetical protein